MSKLTITLSALIILWGPLATAVANADMGATEDDLTEALSRGDIDQRQFDQLLSLIDLGVYLDPDFLQENYDRADFIIDSVAAGLEPNSVVQQSTQVNHHQTLRGRFDYRYSQELNEQGRSRYTAASRVDYSTDIYFDWSIRKELTGRERWVRRQIAFSEVRPGLDRIILGTFTARFANGLLVGYRGKKLDHADQLGEESLLYPDYGGFNGALVESHHRKVNVRTLYASDRSSKFFTTLGAAQIGFPRKFLEPNISLAWNRFGKRQGEFIDDFKAGLALTVRSDKSYLSFESAGQFGDYSSSAHLLNGVMRRRLMTAMIDLWYYGDRFIDLSSGSRSASFSRSIHLDALDYDLTSRRTGQKGGNVATSRTLGHGFFAKENLTVAGVTADSILLENSLAVGRQFRNSITASIEYLHRTRETADGNGYAVNRVRLTLRSNSGPLHWRTFVSSYSGRNRESYLNLFAGLTYYEKTGGSYRLWLNFGRIDALSRTLDYFYGYFSNSQTLIAGLEVELKLAHRYSCSSSTRHLSSVSLSVTRSFL